MTTTFPAGSTLTEQMIYDHYYGGGSHSESTLRNSKKFCPTCRGTWSIEEATWDRQYRTARELETYSEHLDRISDEVLQAILILAQTRKIAAIKMLRNEVRDLPLSVAKKIVEKCTVETVVTYSVTRNS